MDSSGRTKQIERNMKIGNKFISIEITNKSTPYEGPITPEIIEKCISIAFEAHEGQRDKDGNAVILHPLFVGSMGQTDAEKCVGFLHDVVEDTKWTLDDLRDEEIPEEIVTAIGICTHKKNQDYYDYVTLMAGWFADGLIDPDFLSRTTTTDPDNGLISSGDAGVWTANVLMFDMYGDMVDDPDFAITGTSYPKKSAASMPLQ